MFEFIRPKVRTAAAPHARHPASFVTEHYGAWQLGLSQHASLPAEADVPGIIAVGGGKGGVGKSIVARTSHGRWPRWAIACWCSISISAARIFILISGSRRRSLTWCDYLVKQRVGFHDVLAESSHPGLSFVASGREEEWRRFLDSDLKVMKPLWSDIFASRSLYDVDFVVIDLGAGTHRHTMDFFVAAHLGITTVLPEPTSIENAYVFLRMALWHADR